MSAESVQGKEFADEVFILDAKFRQHQVKNQAQGIFFIITFQFLCGRQTESLSQDGEIMSLVLGEELIELLAIPEVFAEEVDIHVQGTVKECQQPFALVVIPPTVVVTDRIGGRKEQPYIITVDVTGFLM
jgi:hypothetical protein